MDRQVARKAWPRRRITIVVTATFISLLAIAAVASAVFGTRRSVVEATRITVSTATRGVFEDEIPLTATVEPQKTMYLDTDQGGQVAERLVESGAVVTVGQPLVRLRNSTLELQVTGQEAQLAEQLFQLTTVALQLRETQLQRSRDLNDIDYQARALTQQLDRQRALAAHGFAKRADIEDAETSLQHFERQRRTVAEARDLDDRGAAERTRQLDGAIALLKQNLEIAHHSLDALTIRAPIAGQLTSLDADPGAFKAQGQRIGQIDDTGAYKLVGAADEFYLGRIQPGESASVEIAGTSHRLTVDRIHPEVKDRQFLVDFRFAGAAPPDVRRGQTVQLRLEIGGAEKALLVGNGPFFDDAGGRSVFVVAADGASADRRDVVLGRRNEDWVEIVSGLSAGERIVTSSTHDWRGVDRLSLHGTLPAERKPASELTTAPPPTQEPRP